MRVTSFLLLSCVGLAITAQAQDCQKPLAGPNMDLKGNDVLLENFPDGIKVTFTCNLGYQSAGGSGAITCTAGTWSTLMLKCERRSCGSAGEVANGQVDYSEGNEFGDKAKVACDEGYQVVGRNEISCGVQGWEGRLPVCEVVKCDPPSVVTFGTFSPVKETYEYREAVQYTCQKDYTLNGSRSLTCSSDGAFQPGPPECVKVKCENPEIQNPDLEWASGSRPPFGFKASVTYKCKSGFTLIGASSLTCGIDNQWSPGIPKCQRMTTTTKATSTTTTTTTTTTSPPRSTKSTPGPTNKPTTPKPTDPTDPTSNATKIIIAISVIAVIVIIASIVGCYCFGVGPFKKKRTASLHDPVPTKDAGTELL